MLISQESFRKTGFVVVFGQTELKTRLYLDPISCYKCISNEMTTDLILYFKEVIKQQSERFKLKIERNVRRTSRLRHIK